MTEADRSNVRWLNAAARLFAIADALEDKYALQEKAFAALVSEKEGNVVEQFKAWTDSIQNYNEAVDPYIYEISLLTGNSELTLRQCNGPEAPGRSTATKMYWSPEYIRNIGRHSSFNKELWTENSGRESAPKFTDDEIESQKQIIFRKRAP